MRVSANSGGDIFSFYNRGFERIGRMYARKMAEDPQAVQDMIKKFPSVAAVLSEVYRVLIRQGRCEDLNTLPETEKRELWEEAKAWSGSSDRETLHRVCKSIIAIGSLI
jgi:ribosomal 50S subunit-associated protein YjgA (DUF615 family)